jgi:hypothetical protein
MQLTIQSGQDGGPAAGAPGGCPAAGLPCLLLTTAPADESVIGDFNQKLLGVRTAIARKAETLRRNLQDLIERGGLERIGFVTLTFKLNIRSRKLAEKRFHSFATHILKKLVSEYIAVPERQQRGAIHYHLAAAFRWDIRSGFDLEACSSANLLKKNGYLGGNKWAPGYKKRFDALERMYLASANPVLKRVWRVIREANERVEELTRKPGHRKFNPGFGRCETLPVLSNADAIAFYVGTYITSQTEHRTPEDKGMRSVRYSLKCRRHHQSFQFAEGGNAKWRKGCKILEKLLLVHDNGIPYRDGKKWAFRYPKDHVRSRFGPRWPHRLAPWIFACYENQDACLNFAAQLPPDMPWHERRVAVERFLRQFRGHLHPTRSAASGAQTSYTSVVAHDAEPKPADLKPSGFIVPQPKQWATWLDKTAGED